MVYWDEAFVKINSLDTSKAVFASYAVATKGAFCLASWEEARNWNAVRGDILPLSSRWA